MVDNDDGTYLLQKRNITKLMNLQMLQIMRRYIALNLNQPHKSTFRLIYFYT